MCPQSAVKSTPVYEPFSPDELVWKNVKHDRVGKRAVTGPDKFKGLAAYALQALQAASAKICGLLHHPQVAHIRSAAAVSPVR
jgi:hypothetical protein